MNYRGNPALAAQASRLRRIRATKSFGVVVHVTPDNFLKILEQEEKPLVIESIGGFFTTKYYYLTHYKGFTFFTKTPKQLDLSIKTEIIYSNKIEIP